MIPRFSPSRIINPNFNRIAADISSSEEDTLSSAAATAWFAIKVKSRHEKVVSELLKSKGYDEFLPLYLRRTMSGKRTLEAHSIPLFPSYLFCRFNPRWRLPILSTRGVVQIVKYGQVPAEIDERVVESVRALTASGIELSPHPYIGVGDEVTIHGGPLDGINGLMVKHKSGERIVVSIHMIQRSVALEIDLRYIRPRIAKSNLQLAS